MKKYIRYIFFMFLTFVFYISLAQGESKKLKTESPLSSDRQKQIERNLKKLKLEFRPYTFETEMSFFRTKDKKLSSRTVKELPRIQRHDLDEYEVRGLYISINRPKASKVFILDPEGKKHTLKVGDFIANRNGQVIAIRENEIVVLEERYSDETGEIIYQKATLVMGKSLSNEAGEEKK